MGPAWLPTYSTMANSNIAPPPDDAPDEPLLARDETSDDRLWENLPDLVLIHLFCYLSRK